MPAWREARRLARANLSERVRKTSGGEVGEARLEDQPVACFYCGERRVTRLVVTRIQHWGAAYKCRDASACAQRQAEDD